MNFLLLWLVITNCTICMLLYYSSDSGQKIVSIPSTPDIDDCAPNIHYCGMDATCNIIFFRILCHCKDGFT